MKLLVIWWKTTCPTARLWDWCSPPSNVLRALTNAHAARKLRGVRTRDASSKTKAVLQIVEPMRRNAAWHCQLQDGSKSGTVNLAACDLCFSLKAGRLSQNISQNIRVAMSRRWSGQILGCGQVTRQTTLQMGPSLAIKKNVSLGRQRSMNLPQSIAGNHPWPRWSQVPSNDICKCGKNTEKQLGALSWLVDRFVVAPAPAMSEKNDIWPSGGGFTWFYLGQKGQQQGNWKASFIDTLMDFIDPHALKNTLKSLKVDLFEEGWHWSNRFTFFLMKDAETMNYAWNHLRCANSDLCLPLAEKKLVCPCKASCWKGIQVWTYSSD